MNPFEVLVFNLSQLGVYNIFLPFLLTFAIFYGLLKKSEILGDDEKVMGVVSLVVAFFVTGYAAYPLGLLLSNIFGIAIVVISGILVIIMFMSMAGYDIGGLKENKLVPALAAIIGVILFIVAGALAIFGVEDIQAESNVIGAIVLLVVMVIAVYLVAKGEGGD